MAKRAKQLELFAGAVDEREVHALGLLGWRDPLWTTKINIPLMDGRSLVLRLIDIRALKAMLRRPEPGSPVSGTASGAKQ